MEEREADHLLFDGSADKLTYNFGRRKTPIDNNRNLFDRIFTF